MRQFIAPKVLMVNGRVSPCNCTDEIVCEYCVQANLILWDKEQHPEKEVQEKIISEIKASGVRKTAQKLKIKHSTISNWIKTGNVPLKYVEMLKSGQGASYPTCAQKVDHFTI